MALYHAHRPQNFSEVIGQNHITTTIKNQVAGDKISHAYLFSGPRGVGKTTVARVLAKTTNCEDKKPGDTEPCNKCNACKEIASSRAIDVIEIDAASHTGVDNVRENIIENAQFKPSKSKCKIFIIDEVHMLSTSAFNALLKTLEEPPKHVIFILATTELHKIPETIISRCQRFNFHKVGSDDLKKYLKKLSKAEDVKTDEEVLDRIINKSDGCVRDAVSLLDQIMASGEKEITNELASLVLPTSNVEESLELVSYLVDKKMKEGLSLINKLASEGADLVQLSNDLIELLRVMMITKSNTNIDNVGIDLNEKVKKELQKINKKLSYKELIILIDLISTRRSEIKKSPLVQLPLELAIIEWCGDKNTTEKQNINEDNDTDTKQNSQTPESNENKKDTKDTLGQKVKKIVTREAKFSLDDAKNKWRELISKIEADSPSLTLALKNADPISVEGNTIKLNTKFDLYKDKLTEKRTEDKIETILSDLLESKVKIQVELEKNKQIEKKEELQELAAAFGGEVV